MHAAIIAINDAIDRGVASTTVNCLLNPSAHLTNISHELTEDYQTMLFEAKQIKQEIAFNKVEFLARTMLLLPHVYRVFSRTARDFVTCGSHGVLKSRGISLLTVVTEAKKGDKKWELFHMTCMYNTEWCWKGDELTHSHYYYYK